MKRNQILTFALAAVLVSVSLVLDAFFGFSAAYAAPGLSIAAAVGIASIDDVSDRETHGSAIAYKVYLLEVHQLLNMDVFPEAVIGENGKRSVTAPISLADSEAPFYIEAHDIPTLITNIEKGDITTSGTNTFVIIAGGDRDEVNNFVEAQQGGKFIIFFKHVKDKQWFILGEPERPMVLSTMETKDDKDGRYTTLTFTRSSTDLPYPFIGKVPELTALAAE
jgi:hypothetical protein